MAAASSSTSSFQVNPSALSISSIHSAPIAAASTSSFQVGHPAASASIAVASSSTSSFQIDHPPPPASSISAPPIAAASSSTFLLPVGPPAPLAPFARQIMTYDQLVAARAALPPFPVSYLSQLL